MDTTTDPATTWANDLAERYVAMWTEPDAERRRVSIRDLFTPDATHVLEPPEEIRARAIELRVPSPPIVVRGHDEMEPRVTRAFEEFVAAGEYTFRSRGNASRLHDVVKFNWEMVPVAGGDAVGVGLDVFVLAPDGRIAVDYQFIET
jgi:hypothetical protein